MEASALKKIIILSSNPSVHLYRWVQLASKNHDIIFFDILCKEDNNNPAIKIIRKCYPIRHEKPLLAMIHTVSLLLDCIRSNAIINIQYVNWFLALFSIIVPVKTVLSFWGSDALIQYKSSKGLKRFIYKLALCKASKVSANSLLVCKVLAKYSKKTLFISWPLDRNGFYYPTQEEKKCAKKFWSIPEDRVVVYSNRIGRELYNILDIVKIFQANFKPSGKYLLFVHFPPGSDEKYVEACVELLGEVEGIYTRKDLSLDERRMQYQASDYYLSFPESDSYPSSLIEAAACGLTLVCSSTTRSYDDIEQDFKMIRLPLSELGPESIEVDETWKKTAREKNFAAIDAMFSQERFMSSIEELYR